MFFATPSKGGIFGTALDATKDMFPSFDMERNSETERSTNTNTNSFFPSFDMENSQTEKKTNRMFPSFDDMERTSEHARESMSAISSLGGMTNMFSADSTRPPEPPQQRQPTFTAPPVPPPAPTPAPKASAPPPPAPSVPAPIIQQASNPSTNQPTTPLPPTPPTSSNNDISQQIPKESSSSNQDLPSKKLHTGSDNEKPITQNGEEDGRDEFREDENVNLLQVPCNYQVLGINQQIVNIKLEPYQRICCEPGVLVHCDPRVDITSQCQFSASRCISGEKQVMNYFSNNLPSESLVVGLTPNTPNSKIIPVDMDDALINNQLTCSKGAWLASLGNADISFQLDCRLVTCCCGGQGIRQQTIVGQGVVFLIGGGTVMRRVMERHERVVIDDHCLLAWSGTVGFASRTASERCRDLLCNCTGEGLFNFVISGGERGGVIYIQSMPFEKFKAGVTGFGDPKAY